jgi:hypothetical protein
MVMAFGGLSRAVRANYSTIQAAVARGVSAKALNAQLTGLTGKGIRRSDLLEGMRFAGGVQTAGRNIGNIPFKNRPNYATLPQFNRITTDKKYLVQYEIRWKDSQSGETGSTFITVGTNETLTREELDAEAQLAWDKGRRQAKYGEHRDIDQLVPMGARQQI